MSPDVPAPAGEPARLNILALPSQTAIIFALIALVVLGAAFASLLPGSQLWWPPIVFGLTLLPVRDFLHWPDRWMRRHGLARYDSKVRGFAKTTTDPDGRKAAATAIIEAELAALVRPQQSENDPSAASEPTGKPSSLLPALTISDQPMEAHAFGSFRRRYVGLSQSMAETVAQELNTPGGRKHRVHRAILAHELAHFLNKDVWLMGLSNSLLKMMVLVALFTMWIGLVLVIFIVEVGPEVMRPEFWTGLTRPLAAVPGLPVPDLGWVLDWLTQQSPTVAARLADPAQSIANWSLLLYYIAASHIPFILSGLVLFGFYWRRLLRVRELYADARAATLMKNAALVPKAIYEHAMLVGLTPTPPSRLARLQGWFRSLPERVPLLGPQLRKHPLLQERKACLAEPQRAFGTWQWIAISIGLVAVLLDLLLRGTLTAAYIYEPGAYLPFLIAFLLLAVWLLPKVCLGEEKQQLLKRALLPAVLLFTGIKLLPHLLDGAIAAWMMLTDPAGWGQFIDSWAYSMTGGWSDGLPRIMGVEVSWPYFFNVHIVRPILYFALLLPPTLTAFLGADTALKRRALTWYWLEGRVRRVFWTITGLLALLLALLVIPIFNHFVFPDVYPSWSAMALGGVVVGLLTVLAGGAVFWHYDRRLAGRCRCGAVIPGEYCLGNTCKACGPLHPWLIANY